MVQASRSQNSLGRSPSVATGSSGTSSLRAPPPLAGASFKKSPPPPSSSSHAAPPPPYTPNGASAAAAAKRAPPPPPPLKPKPKPAVQYVVALYDFAAQVRDHSLKRGVVDGPAYRRMETYPLTQVIR